VNRKCNENCVMEKIDLLVHTFLKANNAKMLQIPEIPQLPALA
jgi:hypothetical protein